ncbi:ribosome biogenesis factor YjgA [Nitrosomonas marina]|uniref:Dual-action ribosomal maturation protein DarP n=1 Tax=Nitrosomonas marina TaxID=917 RepID=A0A1H8AFP2_9PROT|nr:ribosome biogenesis factor YjgA [Nitrosomonas marina]SEM68619.1 ribosome-associated protein [Nitrosomonas marina]
MQNTADKIDKRDDKPSKTQRKLAMHSLQKTGEQLVTLSDNQLAELNLPEDLHEAIIVARQITKFGARQRQMQFIGKLMRRIDVLPIEEKLRALQHNSSHQIALTHLAERWRDQLLSDNEALTEFTRQYSGAETTQIRVLVRNARKEIDNNKAPKNYRQLFHTLLETIKNERNSLNDDIS